jgi:hypothetical protein
MPEVCEKGAKNGCVPFASLPGCGLERETLGVWSGGGVRCANLPPATFFDPFGIIREDDYFFVLVFAFKLAR